MKEQFFGWLWWLSVRVFGLHHSVSLKLELKWSAAYWATRPPLGQSVQYAADCEVRHG